MALQYADLADYGSTCTVERENMYEISLEKSNYLSERFEEKISPDRKTRRKPPVIEAEDAAIEAEIAASACILEMVGEPEDEDFVPYHVETWRRATDFLRRLAMHAHSCGFSGIGVPEVLPGDHGAISLFWRGDKELLMTFPADTTQLISFFARRGKRENAGRFPTTEFTPELIYWLTN